MLPVFAVDGSTHIGESSRIEHFMLKLGEYIIPVRTEHFIPECNFYF